MPRSKASPPTAAREGHADESVPSVVATPPGAPRIIPRDQHTISRKDINPNALKVLYRLHNAGFQAHLVGGGVRDLLLGMHPKDFDVATDAKPEEVRRLFRNCRLIGRRFRLAHVIFGREVVEVATFRAHHGGTTGEDDGDDAVGAVHDGGRILRDNVFGTIEDDAFRRDFTVNALYYDISRFALIDYTEAMADLAARRLRLIGDPFERYREDPVRMLRAARFAAKLDFGIDADTMAPIGELGGLLRDIPPSRLFEETLKLFQTGHAAKSLVHLRRLDLLRYLFPVADATLKAGDTRYQALLERVLENTDRRLAEDKPVTPAFLFAVFLWPAATAMSTELEAGGESPAMAMQRAASRAVDEQQAHVSLPKRFAGPMREIWILQPKLEGYRGKRARRLLTHPRLRAAWDFLCLRRDAGEDLAAICEWWEQAMAASASSDTPPADLDRSRPGQGRPRRRRGGRRRRRGEGGGS